MIYEQKPFLCRLRIWLFMSALLFVPIREIHGFTFPFRLPRFNSQISQISTCVDSRTRQYPPFRFQPGEFGRGDWSLGQKVE